MANLTPLQEAAAAAGAVFTEEAGWQMPNHYGDPLVEYEKARENAVVFNVSHRGKIELTGNDAASFLHNLCSNDIKNLPSGRGCEAFLLNVQARVLAYVLIYRVRVDDSDHFWLDTGPGMAEKVLQHLNRYLISEQVDISDQTSAWAQLHVAGPHSRAALSKALHHDVPELAIMQLYIHPLVESGAIQVRRHDPLGLPGYDILCPRELVVGVWERLRNGGAALAGLQAYEMLRIESGTPEYGKDIDDSHLAPEVGRTAQAISYTKGCYLGQEPVVRIRDLGHVNRLLTGLKVMGKIPLPPGTKLLRDGKEVGQVTSAIYSPRLGATVALAYIRRGNETSGTSLDVDIEGVRQTAIVTSLSFSSDGGTGGA